MHKYSAYEPRPHLFTAVIIIWQGRMVILRLLAYRSSKTRSPDNYVFSVIYTAWRYSSLCLVKCANHSLVTCVLRNHNNGVYHLANNGSRSRNRGIFIAVSLKTKFKRHLPGEFHDCSWVFWSGHCSHKGARRVEERRKKKEENEDDETRFSPFSGSSL